MKLLIQDGVTYPTQQMTEFGRWDQRCFDIESPATVNDGDYFAYVDPDSGADYDPYLVIYSKTEFVALFEDICRRFVGFRPEMRDEYEAALAENGMSLTPTD